MSEFFGFNVNVVPIDFVMVMPLFDTVFPAVVTWSRVGMEPPPEALIVTAPVPDTGLIVTLVPAMICDTHPDCKPRIADRI